MSPHSGWCLDHTCRLRESTTIKPVPVSVSSSELTGKSVVRNNVSVVEHRWRLVLKTLEKGYDAFVVEFPAAWFVWLTSKF